MKAFVPAGKGGVGKSTVAVSLAMHLSRQHKTALIGYDGKDSIPNLLGLDQLPANAFYFYARLRFAIVMDEAFVGIGEMQKKDYRFEEYMRQFPADLGLVPLADMTSQFFGIPTDVAGTQKLTTLARLLSQLRQEQYEYVVIDMEPTTGLGRMLTQSEATIRSLHNLQSAGIARLAALGALWPDIKAYLKSPYIKKVEPYTANLQATVDLLQRATYLVVTTPERMPVAQTAEVEKVIGDFGGTPAGYVINNMRGELHEEEAIRGLVGSAVPLARVARRVEFHAGQPSPSALFEIGKGLAEVFVRA